MRSRPSEPRSRGLQLRCALLIGLQRFKPRTESTYDPGLYTYQAGSQAGMGCRVHALRPRGKRAKRSVRRSLTSDARVEAAGLEDVVGILRPVLDCVPEPVRLARKEALAVSGQVELASPSACLWADEVPLPAAVGRAYRRHQGDMLLDKRPMSQMKPDGQRAALVIMSMAREANFTRRYLGQVPGDRQLAANELPRHQEACAFDGPQVEAGGILDQEVTLRARSRHQVPQIRGESYLDAIEGAPRLPVVQRLQRLASPDRPTVSATVAGFSATSLEEGQPTAATAATVAKLMKSATLPRNGTAPRNGTTVAPSQNGIPSSRS